MKRIIGIILIAVAAVTGGWSFSQTQNEVELSDLALANVEALARYEGDGDYAWSNLNDCSGIGTGDYQVCEERGPKNYCSSPGSKTCDCGRNC